MFELPVVDVLLRRVSFRPAPGANELLLLRSAGRAVRLLQHRRMLPLPRRVRGLRLLLLLLPWQPVPQPHAEPEMLVWLHVLLPELLLLLLRVSGSLLLPCPSVLLPVFMRWIDLCCQYRVRACCCGMYAQLVLCFFYGIDDGIFAVLLA